VPKRRMTVKTLAQLAGGESPDPIDVNFMCPEEFAAEMFSLDVDPFETENDRREQASAVDEFLKKEGLL